VFSGFAKARAKHFSRIFFRVPQKNFCGRFNRVVALACGPKQHCIEVCFTGRETSLQVDKAPVIEGANRRATMRE
jgi:hypothetical protein